MREGFLDHEIEFGEEGGKGGMGNGFGMGLEKGNKFAEDYEQIAVGEFVEETVHFFGGVYCRVGSGGVRTMVIRCGWLMG
jgi:hypothetical protein